MSRDSTSPSVGKALTFQFASRYINVVIQLVITAVLARILTPDEFGLIAIVAVFSSFFTMLSDLGLSPAIVQFDDLSENDYSALLTFSFLAGAVFTALFCICSLPIAAFYDNEALVPLCCTASLSILFSGANMVPNGMLLKARRFKLIGVRLVITTTVSGCIAIALALAGLGGYALIAQSVLQSAFVLIWNLIGTKLRIGNVHFIAPVKRIFRYSGFQAAFGIVNYFAGNLDNLLIGRCMGVNVLGYYDKAYKLNTFPVAYLSAIIGSVLQPYLVKYKESPSAIYNYYLSVAKGIALIGAWISVLFAVCPYEITLLLFGDQWESSAVLLRALGAGIAFQMFNSVAGAFFQTLEHTDYMLYTALINTGITIVAIVGGIMANDIIALAAFVALAKAMNVFANTVFLIGKALHKPYWPFVKAFIPELLIIAFGICAGFIAPIPAFDNLVIPLLIKGIIVTGFCLVVYTAAGQLTYVNSLVALLKGNNQQE